jgi:hypothetical protein
VRSACFCFFLCKLGFKMRTAAKPPFWLPCPSACPIMKGAMKNFIALFLFLSAFPVFSLPLRNITALGMDRYPDGEDVYTLENTLIAGLTSRFSLLGRVRLREASREGEWNRGGSLGLVYLLGPHTYGESSYGIFFEGEAALSHHVSSEISLEKERFLLIGGVKGQLSPEQSTFFSSLAGRYFFVPSFSLWGKYMFIFDTATKAGHSLWAEAAVDPLPGLQIRIRNTLFSGVFDILSESATG